MFPYIVLFIVVFSVVYLVAHAVSRVRNFSKHHYYFSADEVRTTDDPNKAEL